VGTSFHEKQTNRRQDRKINRLNKILRTDRRTGRRKNEIDGCTAARCRTLFAAGS
jgi:hypothetical protein